ncbi:hypothetical protein CE91St36_08910 [Christensenellaceae bacterium]|nr:hypothetical protein CE91St36_08910 [Christensenellaceae bacterium]BDF60742.1 hypothetical protein CE91St37_08920 [Christensenellaceae bacterium]
MLLLYINQIEIKGAYRKNRVFNKTGNMNYVKRKKYACNLKMRMIQYKQIEQIIQMIQIRHKLQILQTAKCL